MARFTVDEPEEKAALNTPGGDELDKSLGGPKGSLPFFAFLDSKGGLIVSSVPPAEGGKRPGNIGHPYKPEEVDWFMAMLAKATPAMQSGEAATLEKYLRNQKK